MRNIETIDEITIVIQLCPNCGEGLEIDRHDTTACGSRFAYVTALCPTCGYKNTVFVVTVGKEADEFHPHKSC